MASLKLCTACADCVVLEQSPRGGTHDYKFRCVHPSAVGPAYEELTEAPRPFGSNPDAHPGGGPPCSTVRQDSLVYETCGTDAKWFRSADDKAKQDAEESKRATKAAARQALAVKAREAELWSQQQAMTG